MPTFPSICEEDKTKIIKCLLELETNPAFKSFLVPIDWTYKKSIVSDYKKTIKTPMDFFKIKLKLGKNQYTKVEQVFNDLNLIWENCLKFNGPDSEFSSNALELKNILQQHYQIFESAEDTLLGRKRQNTSVNNDSQSANSIADICSIISEINKFSADQCVELIAFVNENYPLCLESNSTELKIIFDSLKKNEVDHFYQFIKGIRKDINMKQLSSTIHKSNYKENLNAEILTSKDKLSKVDSTKSNTQSKQVAKSRARTLNPEAKNSFEYAKTNSASCSKSRHRTPINADFSLENPTSQEVLDKSTRESQESCKENAEKEPNKPDSPKTKLDEIFRQLIGEIEKENSEAVNCLDAVRS